MWLLVIVLHAIWFFEVPGTLFMCWCFDVSSLYLWVWLCVMFEVCGFGFNDGVCVWIVSELCGFSLGTVVLGILVVVSGFLCCFGGARWFLLWWLFCGLGFPAFPFWVCLFVVLGLWFGGFVGVSFYCGCGTGFLCCLVWLSGAFCGCEFWFCVCGFS